MPLIEAGKTPQQSHLGTARGRQVKRRTKEMFNRPAGRSRKSGTKRSMPIGIPAIFRPVETLTEHAMFVELLPTFTKGSRVEWYAMARDWNLRVLYSHKLQKPLDASLKHEKRLQEFASAYVKATRSKESMMTFEFPQAMQPLDSNTPTVTHVWLYSLHLDPEGPDPLVLPTVQTGTLQLSLTQLALSGMTTLTILLLSICRAGAGRGQNMQHFALQTVLSASGVLIGGKGCALQPASGGSGQGSWGMTVS